MNTKLELENIKEELFTSKGRITTKELASRLGVPSGKVYEIVIEIMGRMPGRTSAKALDFADIERLKNTLLIRIEEIKKALKEDEDKRLKGLRIKLTGKKSKKSRKNGRIRGAYRTITSGETLEKLIEIEQKLKSGSGRIHVAELAAALGAGTPWIRRFFAEKMGMSGAKGQPLEITLRELTANREKLIASVLEYKKIRLGQENRKGENQKIEDQSHEEKLKESRKRLKEKEIPPEYRDKKNIKYIGFEGDSKRGENEPKIIYIGHPRQ